MHGEAEFILSPLSRLRLAGRLAAPRFEPMPAAEPAAAPPERLTIVYVDPDRLFAFWAAELGGDGA